MQTPRSSLASNITPSSSLSPSWPSPSFEVISLDCEITSYAPDDGDERPLF